MTASLLTERTTQSYWDAVERYRNLLTNGDAKSIIAMISKRIANGEEANRRHLAHQVVQVLDIPDEYQFMDARLVELLQDRVEYFLHQIQEDLTTSME